MRLHDQACRRIEKLAEQRSFDLLVMRSHGYGEREKPVATKGIAECLIRALQVG